MLPSYFDYIFVHPIQKAHLRAELSPKFLSTQARTRPKKSGPTYNSGMEGLPRPRNQSMFLVVEGIIRISSVVIFSDNQKPKGDTDGDFHVSYFTTKINNNLEITQSKN